MRFAADSLAILMSSDWFATAWNLCGLRSNSIARLQVQKECRFIVESITEGCTTYWEADFSESRGFRTKAKLINIIERSGMVHDDQIICKRYLEGVDSMPESSHIIELIETLCSLFASEYNRGQVILGQVDQKVSMSISTALAEANSEQLLVKAGSEALTKWDRWLWKITPDLPTFAVDTARELSRYAGSHAKLLAALRADLSQNDLERLSDWLSETAADLAGVVLPPGILTLD